MAMQIRSAKKATSINPEDSAVIFCADGTLEVAFPPQAENEPIHRHTLLAVAIVTLVGEKNDQFMQLIRARIEEINTLGANLTMH